MLARIRKNDTVVVLSGKDKGKQGSVIEVFAQKGKVVVRGVAMYTKHRKARKSGEISSIKKEEGLLDLSKVMLVCHSCKKPSRMRTKRTAEKAIRICGRCQEAFD